MFALAESGFSKKAIARETGVSRTQVARWLSMGLTRVLGSPMRKHASDHIDGSCQLVARLDPAAYAYLFGQYLGDGSIVRMPSKVFKLSITTCDLYRGIRDECERAMQTVMPGRAVMHQQRIGCTDLYCYSSHWPCVFPQHGRGRKHERPLILRPWQERIVFDRHPDLFLRGLIHSDGCRSLNRVHRQTASGLRNYEYPRYTFTNESGHIHGFFTEACARLGIEWRWMKRAVISIARRDSVARLDAFVGPKC